MSASGRGGASDCYGSKLEAGALAGFVPFLVQRFVAWGFGATPRKLAKVSFGAKPQIHE